MSTPRFAILPGLALAFGMAALAAPSASAQMTTYTLHDVSFNIDGSGTASGFFMFDPTLQTYGSFSLTTSDGSGASSPTYTGSTYDLSNSYAPPNGNGEFGFLSNDGSKVLNLSTGTRLGAGGTYSLRKSQEDYRAVGGTVMILNYRDGTVGTLTASPVPEASPAVSLGLLLALGLGGLLAARRRKTPV